MRRPIGVAVIAVVHFLIAGVYSYSLLNFVVVGMTIGQDNAGQAAVHGISPWREFVGGQPGLALAMLSGYGLIVLTLVTIVVASVVVGVGLWKLANWARILGIAIWFVILIVSAVGLLFRLRHPVGATPSLIRTAMAVTILVYLVLPPVKHSFRGVRAIPLPNR